MGKQVCEVAQPASHHHEAGEQESGKQQSQGLLAGGWKIPIYLGMEEKTLLRPAVGLLMSVLVTMIYFFLSHL